jgi:hypothetical protein
MTRRAIVLHQQVPGTAEARVSRALTFFGVPWQAVSLAQVCDSNPVPDGESGFVILGAAESLKAAGAIPRSAAVLERAAAIYAYPADRRAGAGAMSALTGLDWQDRGLSGNDGRVAITASLPEVTGPMSGLEVAKAAGLANVAVLTAPSGDTIPLVSVKGEPVFVQMRLGGVPTYCCGSPEIVDLDAPVLRNYYDVKEHLLAAVPLVMFINAVFRDVMWRTPELGACLIIDDPLLKGRYGFCDFPRLRDLMREHRFTTNIAFIPWNWRRTTRRASEFFRRESELFSVSVHGCDHVAAEFGAAALDVIDDRARLAQMRMRKHRARTRIKHDPIMVFPQGVFSSGCPGVLKRNGFVAAVNTEISPIGESGPTTLVKDVWDTAILRYGSFPIYTRRYQHHGIENFAFDLLLGKPCFIVAHHEWFRDGGTELVGLVHKLRALNCALRWRSPREVVRRAFRMRVENGRQAVRMFGTEVLLANASERVAEFDVHKPENDPSLVVNISQAGSAVRWSHNQDGLLFQSSLPPQSEALVKVRYQTDRAKQPPKVSMRYELAVAARRILSELRDEYVQRLPLPV